MTKNKMHFGVLILALAAIVVWAAYGMFHAGRDEKSHSVSVIVNNSNSDRWISLRQGLEQAAKDYNMDLNYVSTGELNSPEEELALAQRELENGAEGVILQMVSSDVDLKEWAEVKEKAVIILLETDIKTEGICTYVGPDNRALGLALGEAVKQELGENMKGKKIGILSGNQRQLSMQQRLQGLLEVFESAGAEVVWNMDNKELQERKEKQQSGMPEAADAIVALGNDETERIIDDLWGEEYGGTPCLLYGVGCSEKAVYYLDKGMIHALVVPNEFNMGYQSMESMADALRYHLAGVENSLTGYLVVDRENLYDADNQKVLFPIVQ